MFQDLNTNELLVIDGGVSGEHILAGITFAAVGVGCWAIALTPGVNVVAVAALTYAGAWGIAGGVASATYGAVR